MNFVTITNSKRIKDKLVLMGCIVVMIAFVILLLNPFNIPTGTFLCKLLPFEELMLKTLNEMHAFAGGIFQRFGLKQDITVDAIAWYNALTASELFLGFSSLIVACFIRNLIYSLFSLLFLHGGKNSTDKDSVLYQLIDGNDFLYKVNAKLLHIIATFIATFIAGGIFTVVEKGIGLINNELANATISGLLLLALWIVYSISYMLRHNNGEGLFKSLFSKDSALASKELSKIVRGKFFLSARQSMLRTALCVIFPNAFTMLVANTCYCGIMLVCEYDIAWWMCFLVGLGMLPMMVLTSMLESALESLAEHKLPYCGRFCTISVIFGAFPTAITVLIFYCMIVSNFEERATVSQDFVLFLQETPFFLEWTAGLPIIKNIFSSFAQNLYPLFSLLLICSAASILQYVSTSFLVTLITQAQIYFRPVFWSVNMVVILVAHAFTVLAEDYAFSNPKIAGIMVFFAAFLYVIFVLLQPLMALKGVLTTGVLLVVLNFLPATLMMENGVVVFDFTHLLGYLIFAFCLLLALELIQNLIAVGEKIFSIKKAGAGIFKKAASNIIK